MVDGEITGADANIKAGAFPATSAPGGRGNLPAPQSMHAAELDAPVAELYVPAEGRSSEQSQGGKAVPEGQAMGTHADHGNTSSPSERGKERNQNANVHTRTQSGEEAAMVDGGTNVQTPISRRWHSRPPSAPGG
jgi:hypothetical protein